MGFPGGSESQEFAQQCRRSGFDPWGGKIPWRREWLPTPVFLSGEFCGQRSLAGYSPWGYKESDTTERLSAHTHTSEGCHFKEATCAFPLLQWWSW